MGSFHSELLCVGLIVQCAVSSLLADQIVDTTFNDNQNDMEFYWFCYDDSWRAGPTDRPQAAPQLAPTVIHGNYDEYARRSTPEDDWQIRDYEIQTGVSVGEPCASLPFTMGQSWEITEGGVTFMLTPYCGIGTALAGEGESIDLTGADSISFKIKSRVGAQRVRFMVHTLPMDIHSDKALNEAFEGGEFAYHQMEISAKPGEWTRYAACIGGDPTGIDIKQPVWVDGGVHQAGMMDFDITRCTKLVWEVVGEDGNVDTLDVADVKIISNWHKIVIDSVWIPTTDGPQEPYVMFSDFETAPVNESPLLTYWYAYSDIEYNGNTAVPEEYAQYNAATGHLNINFNQGSGSDGEGRAAAIKYTLGEEVTIDGHSVPAYVGIGCNLYDSAAVQYWNVVNAEICQQFSCVDIDINSIYFEYFNDGDNYLVFELLDIHDVGDADNPQRKFSRGNGSVHHINLPPTGAEWKKVNIPFSELIINRDADDFQDIPLDRTQLAKIQWKVQGAEGTQGTFGIDNIAFTETSNGVNVSKPHTVKTAGITTFYSNGAVQVSLSSGQKISRGTIELINLKGATVHSVSIQKSQTLSIPATTLSAGLYFVKVDGMGSDGAVIRKTSSLNIIK